MKERELRGLIKESIKKVISERYDSYADELRKILYDRGVPHHDRDGNIVIPDKNRKHEVKKAMSPEELKKEKESWAEAMKKKLSKKDIESCTRGEMNESKRLQRIIKESIRGVLKEMYSRGQETPEQILQMAQVVVSVYGNGNCIDLNHPEDLIETVKYVMRSERCSAMDALLYMSGIRGGGWG